MPENGNNLACHKVDIPEINLQAVPHHLRDPALLGNKHRCAVLHRLKGSKPERLGYRRHYIEVSHLVSPRKFFTGEKTCKEHFVGYTKFGCSSDNLRRHVTGACHNESHIRNDLKNAPCSCQEVVRPFLEGHPAKEQNHFVPCGQPGLPGRWVADINRIVHYLNLIRLNSIVVDNHVLGVVAYRNNEVSCMHAMSFHVINVLVWMASCPVEFCGMNVNYQRLACLLLCMHACPEAHPVVGMDDIKVLVLSYKAGSMGIPAYFRKKVLAVYCLSLVPAPLKNVLAAGHVGCKQTLPACSFQRAVIVRDYEFLQVRVIMLNV